MCVCVSAWREGERVVGMDLRDALRVIKLLSGKCNTRKRNIHSRDN